MKKGFSCYLDLVRLIAAILVVIDHTVTHHILSPTLGAWLPMMGRESVVVFFVLSGLVIAYVCDVKEQTLGEYAIARAARIYSVALPLLLFVFVAAFTLEHFRNISLDLAYQLPKFYLYIPFHSLFLGELWNNSETPVWLDAYWSLGYEVWYYIFFGAVFFLRGRTRWFFSIGIFLLLGHKLWLLLPVWYAGVVLWRQRERMPMSVARARVGMLLSIALLVLYKYLHWDDYLRITGNALWPFPRLPLGGSDRYLGDYLVGAVMSLNFYCARYAALDFGVRPGRWITTLSSSTFALYLTHGVVIAIWWSVHARAADGGDSLLIFVAIAVATCLVGQLSRPVKRWLVQIFAHGRPGFMRRRGQAAQVRELEIIVQALLKK